MKTVLAFLSGAFVLACLMAPAGRAQDARGVASSSSLVSHCWHVTSASVATTTPPGLRAAAEPRPVWIDVETCCFCGDSFERRSWAIRSPSHGALVGGISLVDTSAITRAPKWVLCDRATPERVPPGRRP